MKPEQRAVYAQTVAGRRGSVPANVLVWLKNPDLAARAQKLGELIRYDTSMPPRLSELAILVVAKHWRTPYEWAVHAVEARKAGVNEAVIEAIRVGKAPFFTDHPDKVLFEFTSTVVAEGRVSDEQFKDWLVAAHRASLLTLHRADLVFRDIVDDVIASETAYLNARWHYVEIVPRES